jgi:hypothetical protein
MADTFKNGSSQILASGGKRGVEGRAWRSLATDWGGLAGGRRGCQEGMEEADAILPQISSAGSLAA